MNIRNAIKKFEEKNPNSAIAIIIKGSKSSEVRQLNTVGSKRFGSDAGYTAIKISSLEKKIKNFKGDFSIWRLDKT